MDHVNPLTAPIDRTSEKENSEKENERARRRASPTADRLLRAVDDYSRAHVLVLADNMCAMDAGAPLSRGWLDLQGAASALSHAYAAFIAFGIDPVAKVRSETWPRGERGAIWYGRVADDLAARLVGTGGAIPSTDDLPPPPNG